LQRKCLKRAIAIISNNLDLTAQNAHNYAKEKSTFARKKRTAEREGKLKRYGGVAGRIAWVKRKNERWSGRERE